jgi:hypothetical protein
MQTKSLLTASVFALAATAPAGATPQETIDRIVDDLSRQGYVRIEIDIERDGSFDVDAYGGGREGDFYYDAAGRLLGSEVERDDAYGAGYRGEAPGRDDNRSDDRAWRASSGTDWAARDDDDDDDDDDWSGRDDGSSSSDYDDDDDDDD